jgi:TetR/AcrR family transcriptional regulator, cholesterol catabolism regulator
VSSAQNHTGPRRGRQRANGTKRAEILAAATERFGRDGYEATKWADIAADVGVGPTALYHYFESKQHCLFVILDEAVQLALARFERATADHPDPADALRAIVADAFELTPHDVQRLRVLVAEHGLLMVARRSPREEEARQTARARTRALELAWATLLARAMERGAIAEGDARLLARAVLGLYNSTWQWYRPYGPIALGAVSDFYRSRMLELLGLPPGVDEAKAA